MRVASCYLGAWSRVINKGNRLLLRSILDVTLASLGLPVPEEVKKAERAKRFGLAQGTPGPAKGTTKKLVYQQSYYISKVMDSLTF